MSDDNDQYPSNIRMSEKAQYAAYRFYYVDLIGKAIVELIGEKCIAEQDVLKMRTKQEDAVKETIKVFDKTKTVEATEEIYKFYRKRLDKMTKEHYEGMLQIIEEFSGKIAEIEKQKSGAKDDAERQHWDLKFLQEDLARNKALEELNEKVTKQNPPMKRDVLEDCMLT